MIIKQSHSRQTQSLYSIFNGLHSLPIINILQREIASLAIFSQIFSFQTKLDHIEIEIEVVVVVVVIVGYQHGPLEMWVAVIVTLGGDWDLDYD